MTPAFHQLLIASVQDNAFLPEIYTHQSNFYNLLIAPTGSSRWYECGGEKIAAAWADTEDPTLAEERDLLEVALNQTSYRTPELFFERLLELELQLAQQLWSGNGAQLSEEGNENTPPKQGKRKVLPKQDGKGPGSGPQNPERSGENTGASSTQNSSDQDPKQYRLLMDALDKINGKEISPTQFRKMVEALEKFGDKTFTVTVTSGAGELEYSGAEGNVTLA
ncbi:hypothetical protein LG634_07265 [Streptomyces bambusae]|uniref:hypothetical protein n=1 Tax=Streptomyces bambusae TaxID=1550616 RepID=UPI001CFCA5F5|nr:hypothetical protein [Streptomyces bambusae]MCB5164631.1 hypothetical protein [Streptomyces bambusae]